MSAGVKVVLYEDNVLFTAALGRGHGYLLHEAVAATDGVVALIPDCEFDRACVLIERHEQRPPELVESAARRRAWARKLEGDQLESLRVWPTPPLLLSGVGPRPPSHTP